MFIIYKIHKQYRNKLQNILTDIEIYGKSTYNKYIQYCKIIKKEE